MPTTNPLTLDAVARDPARFSQAIGLESGEELLLRPLLPEDVTPLAHFLAGLSPETRRFSTFPSYDRAAAETLCDAINRFDKLRMVLVTAGGAIAGLLEFSFDVPPGDIERYQGYGLTLDPATDCRFGPTLADAYQNRGLAGRVFPFLVALAKRFGQKRMILLGGVLKDNRRAIRFYQREGFREVGESWRDGALSIDMARELS